MIILLAPSETKTQGGTQPFSLDSLLFPQLTPTRHMLIQAYLQLLEEKDPTKLAQLFGLKKTKDIRYHSKDITQEPTMKAILRYQGVAFDYLDYPTLTPHAQTYIDQHVVLFSNLFGFLRADDLIPEYRLKQGSAINGIRPEQYYKKESHLMENYLEDEDILDLRAGFYTKFYQPQKSYTTLKFIKGGKVISHWAKAYRGKVLREIAKAQTESLDAFMNLAFEDLTLKEIQQQKNKTEIIYEITP